MVAAFLLVSTLVVAQPHSSPIDYHDAKGRFELRLVGSWTKHEEPDAPWEACFDDDQGVRLSIHVHSIAAGTDVKTAAAASAEAWTVLKSWTVSLTRELPLDGRTVLVEAATYFVPDADLPETDQTVAVRLVHAVLGEWLVTIAIQGEPDASSRLDLVADRAGRGLTPVAPAPAARSTDSPAADSEVSRAIDFHAPTLQPFPVSFVAPPRWRVSHVEKGDAILVSSVESGIVLVHAGLYDSFDPLYARATALLADLGFRGETRDKPREDPLGNLRGTIVTSTGSDAAGHGLVARARTVLSDKGIGMVAVGFATPAAIRDLGPRINEIVRPFRFGDLTPERDAMAKLAGTWNLDKSAAAPHGAFGMLVFAADGTMRATLPPGA
ncbi:MAG: hypothetical protein HYR85_09980, partial [Planctomycetes bacterium]|nr:hypothetical protein [Planctomycetota bacterium]